MNQADAYQVLSDALAVYQGMGFGELRPCVGQTFTDHTRGDDGTAYIIEVAVHWVDREMRAVVLEGMVAVAGSGPLRRLDRSVVVENRNV